MVFSASSTTSLLGESGRQRPLPEAHPAVRRRRVARDAAPVAARDARLAAADAPAVAVSFVLLLAVLIPGIGSRANGARRWIGVGLFQVQPSEFAKLALILYGAHLLAPRPQIDPRDAHPGALSGGCRRSPALLIVAEPDLGTRDRRASARRGAAGRGRGQDPPPGAARRRDRRRGAARDRVRALPDAAADGLPQPDRRPGRRRLSGDPGHDRLRLRRDLRRRARESLQKAFYLPEAHTDMIAAVIGEELGLVGIATLVGLFGLFGYAGLRDRAAGARPLRQAARRRAHLADPGPGDRQPVRGARARAAHRRAPAVRLLRQLQPAGDAGGGRTALERRRAAAGPPRPPSAPRRRCETAGPSMAAARRAAPDPREEGASGGAKSRHSRGGNRRARGAGARRRRRASG